MRNDLLDQHRTLSQNSKCCIHCRNLSMPWSSLGIILCIIDYHSNIYKVSSQITNLQSNLTKNNLRKKKKKEMNNFFIYIFYQFGFEWCFSFVLSFFSALSYTKLDDLLILNTYQQQLYSYAIHWQSIPGFQTPLKIQIRL